MGHRKETQSCRSRCDSKFSQPPTTECTKSRKFLRVHLMVYRSKARLWRLAIVGQRRARPCAAMNIGGTNQRTNHLLVLTNCVYAERKAVTRNSATIICTWHISLAFNPFGADRCLGKLPCARAFVLARSRVARRALLIICIQKFRVQL